MDPYRYELASIWPRNTLFHQTFAFDFFQSTIEFGVLTNGTTFSRILMNEESYQFIQQNSLHCISSIEHWIEKHKDWFYLSDGQYSTAVPFSVVREYLPKVRLSYPMGTHEDVIQWLQGIAEEYAFSQHIWILPDGKKARAMITYYLQDLEIEACKQEFVSSCSDWDKEGIRLVLLETTERERRYEVYL